MTAKLRPGALRALIGYIPDHPKVFFLDFSRKINQTKSYNTIIPIHILIQRNIKIYTYEILIFLVIEINTLVTAEKCKLRTRR